MTDKLNQVAIRMIEQAPLYSNEPMNSPEAAIRVMESFLGSMDRELFCIVNLQTDLKPINMNVVSMGALDYAVTHPREVFKSAILSNASGILLIHNHPSGSLAPSRNDIAVTERLQQAGKILGIEIYDHIITGKGGSYYSFSEQRILSTETPTRTNTAETVLPDAGMTAEPGKRQKGASRKQIEYATSIARLLDIDTPDFNDRFAVGVFIAKNKENASQRQSELNRQITEQIKRDIHITDVAREMGFHVKKVGNYFTIEEHDSVRITRDNYYFRNSTGEKGTVIDFVMNFSGQGKNTVLQNLAEKLNYHISIIDFPESRPSFGEKQEKTFVLPQKAASMRNMFAYLTQARYIDSEIVQELVNRKMLYQDVRNNCVFVSYHADKPVFATLKGTNTYVPFSGDVSGSDYRYCWHMGNGSQRLQVYEAPIDAMSRMSMFLHSGKNYLDYDYLALTGTGKYEAVFHHLRAAEAEGRPYTDVYVCTDNDSGGTLCLENISRTLKQDFPDTAVHADRPLITNDWNDELKYVFAHGWRYENYINPFDEQLQGILETQLLALANGNTKEYYQIADQLQKSGFPRDTGLENYMIDYLQKNYDKTMSELMSGKGQHTAIKNIISQYNRGLPLGGKRPAMEAGVEL